MSSALVRLRLNRLARPGIPRRKSKGNIGTHKLLESLAHYGARCLHGKPGALKDDG